MRRLSRQATPYQLLHPGCASSSSIVPRLTPHHAGMKRLTALHVAVTNHGALMTRVAPTKSYSA